MAVWEDLKFKEAAERSGFDPGYIATVASINFVPLLQRHQPGQPVNNDLAVPLSQFEHTAALLQSMP